MADMNFEIETSIDFGAVLYIVPNQIGINCSIEITYQTDENEDGSKLVFRAASVIKRNHALKGLYKAFKKHRRGKSNSTAESLSSVFR